MNDDYIPQAGDFVWTDFDPNRGREQGGRRAALEISPRQFYEGARLLIVCPITSKIRPFGSSVVLPANFPLNGEILTSHVRSIDALARPIRDSRAKVTPEVLAEVRAKLAFLCGISISDRSAPHS
jgi:mRNA interferase MazF